MTYIHMCLPTYLLTLFLSPPYDSDDDDDDRDKPHKSLDSGVIRRQDTVNDEIA